jgi:hypothetical protein
VDDRGSRLDHPYLIDRPDIAQVERAAAWPGHEAQEPEGCQQGAASALRHLEREVTSLSVPATRRPRHDGGRWETVRYALDSNARTFRLCLILLVTAISPVAAAVVAVLIRHMLLCAQSRWCRLRRQAADRSGRNLVAGSGAIKLKNSARTMLIDGSTVLLTSSRPLLCTSSSVLRRAIRRAQPRDMVARNAADLVTTPRGRKGRPSKALTLGQAIAVPAEARRHWLYAYVAIGLRTGVRTEDARALQWSHVVAWVNGAERWQPVTQASFEHAKLAVYVWRSTIVTQTFSRYQLRPVIETGATAMNTILNRQKNPSPA